MWHFSWIFLKNNGTSSHSFFEIFLILDFISPSKIRESGFSNSITSNNSDIVSLTDEFFPIKISFDVNILSKPI